MTNASADEALAAIISSYDVIGGRYRGITSLKTGDAGNFSLMFRAVDQATGEQVVLKFLNPTWNGTYRESCFHREAIVFQKLAGRENVVQIRRGVEVLELDLTHPGSGLPLQIPCNYLALERAKGDFASYLLARKKPPALSRRLEIVRDAVRGLNRLHRTGYCHRDLKPDNIFIFSGGTAKVGDFGTARSLAADSPVLGEYENPVGASAYTAPEILCGGWNNRGLFRGADWFSIGATLFEALTGVQLYAAIGLKGADLKDMVATFRLIPEQSRLQKFEQMTAAIAGPYPVPSLLEFADEPWFAHSSPQSIESLDRLVGSLCHFHYCRRLIVFDRVLRRLDICLHRARLDQAKYSRLAMRRRTRTPSPTASVRHQAGYEARVW